MVLKELKALVKALEYDMMVNTGCENTEIAFIQYDNCDEKVVVDYYINDSADTIRYTYSLGWTKD